jgi:hypothetical protein
MLIGWDLMDSLLASQLDDNAQDSLKISVWSKQSIDFYSTWMSNIYSKTIWIFIGLFKQSGSWLNTPLARQQKPLNALLFSHIGVFTLEGLIMGRLVTEGPDVLFLWTLPRGRDIISDKDLACPIENLLIYNKLSFSLSPPLSLGKILFSTTHLNLPLLKDEMAPS